MNPDHPRATLFGEVLYDRFPDQTVLGGAPFNVAWHLQAFGQSPLFISRVGHDAAGDDILRAMAEWAMDTRGVQRDPEHPTGTVDVELLAEGHRFDIVDNCAYDFIDREALPTPLAGSLLYHGTLALRHQSSRRALARLKDAKASVFLDVNLREPWWQPEAVQVLLSEARWLKLNDDELRSLAPCGEDLAAAAQSLREAMQLDLVVVTCGARGALAVDAGGELHEVQPVGEQAVVDTVGAGDAFASVLMLGLLRGWPLDRILERAQCFASAIVGRRGALVRQRDFYRGFSSQWDLDAL